ncbi:FAD-dependent oxidoreductase [Streptomyces coeruleorubidus]|uniref:NAD(P)/FAD-dependent oxidoreductase n=1 Tax=Streptomyces coeruleorubidus TaxID=116188 RepID=UPI0033E3276B
MTSGGRLLIVGAGQAGVQTASSARELGWRGPITLLGAEPHAPYARPPLSKAFLTGTATAASLALRTPEFYADHRIDLVLDERVRHLDLAGDGAGSAVTASGRAWDFDRLVLATGAAPRRLPLEGAGLDGVIVLRDLHDAMALARRLAAADHMVVVGGGFVGLEVAAAAAAAGVRTTVVEAASSLMNRVVSPVTAEVVERAHRTCGIRVLTGVRPARFVADAQGAVAAVELDNGVRLPAHLVLVGVGADPRDDLAAAAGLHCDNGIVVDERSLASDGHTLAVGDCANLPDPSPGPGPAPRLRLESVDNAVEQARAAATTLAGSPQPYRSVPWFWSDQGGLKLQIAGLARPDDYIIVRAGKHPGQHTTLRYRGAHLVAAECVNSPADCLAVRKALAAGTALHREAAADTRVPLKQHLSTAMTTLHG